MLAPGRKLLPLTTVAVVTGLALGGCKQNDPPAGTGATPPPSAASAPKLPPAPPAPWYVGTWEASLQLTQQETALVADARARGQAIAAAADAKPGAKQSPDAGPQLSAELQLAVTEDAAIAGSLKPATSTLLPTLQVQGQVDDSSFRLRLRAETYHGTLILQPADSNDSALMTGQLALSSADSLTVYRATVLLKKDASSVPASKKQEVSP